MSIWLLHSVIFIFILYTALNTLVSLKYTLSYHSLDEARSFYVKSSGTQGWTQGWICSKSNPFYLLFVCFSISFIIDDVI